MKLLKNFLLVAAFGFFLTACGSEGNQAQESATETHEHMDSSTDKSGPEYTSAFVCPMHCEGSGSDEPGKCPVCGMDYVKNTEI